MSARKYIISIPSLAFSQQVFPINDDDLVIKYGWNFPARIFYKKELSENLMFSNSNGNLDFDLFYFYEAAPNVRCEEFILYIYETCEGAEILKYTGTFSLNNCTFDLSRCTVEIKPEPKDAYSCIEANRGKLYNILSDPDIISTTAALDFNYEFESCMRTSNIDQGSSCDPDASGTWGVFHLDAFPLTGSLGTNHDNPIWTEGGVSTCATQNPIYITIVYREYIHTACIGGVANPPPGSGWVLESDDCATLGTAKWIRFPSAGDYPYSGGNASEFQNQDIGYGYFDGVDCIPPSAAVNQQITVTATPSTPPIQGLTEAISQFSGSTIEYTYEVQNNPNSTYVWSSPGFTVTSGAGTNKITGYFSTNLCADTIVITCTETHGNAYVSAATISVTVDGGVAGSCPGNAIGTHDINGLDRICVGKQDVYSIPEIPTKSGGDTNTTITMVWSFASVGAGTAPAIISGQGTKEIIVEAGTANFTVQYSLTEQWSGTGPSLAVTTGSMKVVVTNVPVCHPIRGIFEVYSGEPQIPFDVITHSGATYNWFAGNGDSGNGSSFTFFASPTASTCLTLKETLNCGCNFVLIASGVVGNAHPCVYWCKNNVTSAIYSTVYSRNRRLQAACEGVINNMTCGLSGLVSDFFEWNPPGDTPGYVAGTNYWTNDINKLTNLTISQKSDIVRPNTSNPATIGNMTFEQVEIVWREMFNAYWFIENGKMRVEHLSWFQKTSGYDSTDATNNKYNIAKKKYNYNVEKMPKFERFKFAESLFEDFLGADIWYDSVCVSQRAEENVEARGCAFISTDLYYINLFPQDINEDGFVIICNDVTGAGVYNVNSEIGLLSGNDVQNGHLSWANLLPTYHKAGRVLILGYMNNVITNFVSTKPIKAQKEIIIILCCDTAFEPEKYLVTTELGDAHIEDAEYNLKDHTVKLNLLLP